MKVVTVEHRARARLGSWPYEPEVAHLVLLDHHMIPDTNDVSGWVRQAAQRGANTVRTGALFPAAVHSFVQAGFHQIDTLALLTLNLQKSSARAFAPLPKQTDAQLPRLHRLRSADLVAAARVDRLAFDAPWSNDADSLAEVWRATPHQRSRAIVEDDRIVAFSISGRSTPAGYIQRLAVEPAAQGRGLGSGLVIDALAWMQRRRVAKVMVNTAIDNKAALRLYESIGFEVQSETLAVLEHTIDQSPT